MRAKVAKLASAVGATATEFGRWRSRRAIPWRWQALILLEAMARGERIAPVDLLILRSRNRTRPRRPGAVRGGRASHNHSDGSRPAISRGAARA